MKLLLGAMAVISAVVVIPASTLTAQRPPPADEPILTRQRIMQVNERALTLAFNLAAGRIPWDAAMAKAALLQIAGDLEHFPDFFPAGTDRAPSNATPAAWSDRAGLVAQSQKMVMDARAAADAATTAQALNTSPAFMQVQRNCTGCHTPFRKPT
jgi:cytochrome c556